MRTSTAVMTALAMMIGLATIREAAAFPDADGTVHTCVHRKRGTLRVVEAGTACRKKEQALTLDGPPAPLIFTDATLLNGWVDARIQSGTGVVGFAKDHQGVVHLRGTVDGMGATAFVAFVLPEGHRPSMSVFATATTFGGAATVAVRIRPNGEMAPWDPESFIPTNGLPTILDGVSFVAQ